MILIVITLYFLLIINPKYLEVKLILSNNILIAITSLKSWARNQINDDQSLSQTSHLSKLNRYFWYIKDL